MESQQYDPQQYDPNNPPQYNPYQQPTQYPIPPNPTYQQLSQQQNIPTTAPKPPTKLNFLDEIMLLEKKALIILATIIVVIVIVVVGSYLYYANSTADYTAHHTPPDVKIANLDTLKSSSVYTNTSITFDASDSRDNLEIKSYMWDFGDETTKSGKKVTHEYARKGEYTVKLMVTDSDGLTTTEIFTIHILNTLPTADFTTSKTTFQTKETITLDASASSDIDGSITSYSWDFGDGGTSSGVTTTYKYAKKGVSTITLTVIDNDGNSTTKSIDVTVLNTPPIANAGSSRTVYVNSVVSFDGGASTDSDGTIAKYEWDFGDGNRGDRSALTHKYTTVGSYTAQLTVTDNDGGQDTAKTTITVIYDLSVYSANNLHTDNSAVFSSDSRWKVGVDVSFLNSGESKVGNTIKVTVQVFIGNTIYADDTKTYTSTVGSNQRGTISFSEDDLDLGTQKPPTPQPDKIRVILFYNNQEVDSKYYNIP